MTSPLVEGALAATYQLSPTGSGRLRRLTSASGLANENILSRVALVTSLKDATPIATDVPPVGGKGKEIKGSTLLGRPGPASLMVAMILRHRQMDAVTAAELRTLIIGHWERGLKVINASAGGGSVVDQIAQNLLESGQQADDQSDSEMGASRDRIAAALGREFGRLPVEVRRLLAMVGRFDLGRARAAASELIEEVSTGEGSARVSESQAMRVVGSWGLNRLGMTAADAETMRTVHEARDGIAAKSLDGERLEFLCRLGLVDMSTNDQGHAIALPSARAAALGPESWRQ